MVYNCGNQLTSNALHILLLVLVRLHFLSLRAGVNGLDSGSGTPFVVDCL